MVQILRQSGISYFYSLAPFYIFTFNIRGSKTLNKCEIVMVLPTFSKVCMRGSEGVQVPPCKKLCYKKYIKKTYILKFWRRTFLHSLRIFADPFPGMLSSVLLNNFSLNESGKRIYKQITKGKK